MEETIVFLAKILSVTQRHYYRRLPQEDGPENSSHSTDIISEALSILNVDEAVLLIPTLVIVVAIPLISWFLFRKRIDKKILSLRTIMFWTLFWMAILFVGVWTALRPTGLHFIAILIFIGWLFNELKKDDGHGGKTSDEISSENDEREVGPNG